MSNIKSTNGIILKRPIVQKAEDSPKNFTHIIIPDSKSEKMVSEPRKFELTSQIIKPAARNMENLLK